MGTSGRPVGFISFYSRRYAHSAAPARRIVIEYLEVMKLCIVSCFLLSELVCSDALGPLGAILGPLRGRSWSLLGGSWRALGAILWDLGRTWGDLGSTWRDLGASWEDLGGLLGLSWGILAGLG